jgi:hypothetical protein
VTGILLTALVHGCRGLLEFRSRLHEWRVGIQSYAVALLTPPVVMTATLFALSRTSPAFLPGVFTSDHKTSILLFGVAPPSERVVEPHGAGELTMSAFAVSTALGIFVGYLTAFRILMVWVYEHTESVWLAMLMHASFTSSLLVLNPVGPSGTHLVAYSFALAAAVWVVVAAVTIANRQRLWRAHVISKRAA